MPTAKGVADYGDDSPGKGGPSWSRAPLQPLRLQSEKEAVNFLLGKVAEPHITAYVNHVSREVNAKSANPLRVSGQAADKKPRPRSVHAAKTKTEREPWPRRGRRCPSTPGRPFIPGNRRRPGGRILVGTEGRPRRRQSRRRPRVQIWGGREGSLPPVAVVAAAGRTPSRSIDG